MVTRALVMVGLCSLLATGAAAQSEALETGELPAKLAFERGLRLLRDQRWAEAEAQFRSSLAAIPRASARYNLAFVLFKQGRVRDSVDTLQQLLNPDDSAAPDPRYREAAKVLLAEALASLAIVHLRIAPESALLRIDGEPVTLSGRERSVPLDPGDHRLEISAPGFVSQTFTLVTQTRFEATREIVLEPLPLDANAALARRGATRLERSPQPQPSWLEQNGPWLTLGVGGAALVAGIVTGILAGREDEKFSAKCPSHEMCDPQLQGEARRIGRLAQATNIMLASGGTLIAGGIAWRVIADASRRGDPHGLALTLDASAHF